MAKVLAREAQPRESEESSNTAIQHARACKTIARLTRKFQEACNKAAQRTMIMTMGDMASIYSTGLNVGFLNLQFGAGFARKY